MPQKAPEEIQVELDKAKQIIDTQPGLYNLAIKDLNEKLADISNDTRKYRLPIIAILFVSQIQDFSYDSLSSELVNENVSKYACRHIMYLLQTQHHISCFPLMESAINHNTIIQLMPYFTHNIVYESTIDKPVFQKFFDYMHFIPKNNQMYIFQSTAELIYSNMLSEDAFSYLSEKQPLMADSFAPYLLGVLYQNSRENGDKWLTTLFSSKELSL